MQGFLNAFCKPQRPAETGMLALLVIGNATTTSRTGLLHMLLVTCLAVFWSYEAVLKRIA